jgi:hypothetical protein
VGRFLPFFFLYLLASVSSVFGCEGCKEPVSVAGASGVDGISTGFSASVLFMLGTVATVVGGLLWMIVRHCKQLETGHQLASLRARFQTNSLS